MKTLRAGFAATTLFALAACAGGEAVVDTAEREREIETMATVQAVNADTREVVLETADGRILTVEAGPAVRNFEQIDVGDTVRALYVESVALTMAESGETMPTEADLIVERAPEGAVPGALIATETTTTVELVAYDPATGVATFTTPEGATHSLVVDPAMRAFAERRAPGDLIDVHYTAAVAVLVEETSGL